MCKPALANMSSGWHAKNRSVVRYLFGLLLLLCAACAGAAVEANTANEAELDGVKGLGPSSTARILAARNSGPFADWADLMRRVRGIKPATAHKLSQQGLTVNNATYEPAPPGAKAP